VDQQQSKGLLMFAITLIIGQMPFSMMWRTEKAAQSAVDLLTPKFESPQDEWLKFSDDFGHSVGVPRSNVKGYIFEDMDQTKLAHCERALHQQKTQNLAQKMAEADPGIRASRMVNGPMLEPFPRHN
jgi:hypothetical protein